MPDKCLSIDLLYVVRMLYLYLLEFFGGPLMCAVAPSIYWAGYTKLPTFANLLLLMHLRLSSFLTTIGSVGGIKIV